MSDIFISYSRLDSDFAKKLTNALVDTGRDIWIDWEDIARGADWLQEIYAGIESADTFVFIVSENSLISEICNKEIEYARRYHKRIIPLILSDITKNRQIERSVKAEWFDATWRTIAEENWQVLSSLNWLFFNTDAVFENEFEALITALETDLKYVKLHTRLLIRAREWETGGKSPSFLLKGDEIIDAETWMASGIQENKQPIPTPLHEEYIEISRKHDKDEKQQLQDLIIARQASKIQAKHAQEAFIRSRRIALLAGVATVIAIITGIVIGLQANKSLVQANIAATSVAEAVNAQQQALYLKSTADIGATQLAENVAFFRLQQDRVATLAAGGVVIPPQTTSPNPDVFIATLTQIAKLNEWKPVEQIDEFGVEMVQVPPGCFYMGSIASADEQPVHQQCFEEPFWLDKYEVTQLQYFKVTGNTYAVKYVGDLNPVDSIDWFSARDYCALRNARLPTEREWEYAARGPNSPTFPWGKEFIVDITVDKNPFSIGHLPVINSDGSPQRPKGSSWVGALDMLGNVWEWTSTRYDELYVSEQDFNLEGHYPYPYNPDDGRESVITLEEYKDKIPIYTINVLRGGSFDWLDPDLRAADRDWLYADGWDTDVGFRCARS